MPETMRLFIVVEGQTEDNFVRQTLKPHLLSHNVIVASTVAGKAKAADRGKSGHGVRGGNRFVDWQKDIRNILRSNPSRNVRVSTLIDLYGLPDDFPDRNYLSGDQDTSKRCDRLEGAMQNSIAADNDDCGAWRLIPYIQRHEFEALVLAAVDSLMNLYDAEDQLMGLENLKTDISGLSPEEINDNRITSPSHRLMDKIPNYRKSTDGPDAIDVAGLDAVRDLCPRFHQWLSRMEGLPDTAAS